MRSPVEPAISGAINNPISGALGYPGGAVLPKQDLLFYTTVFSPTTNKVEDKVGANERTIHPLQYIQCDGTGDFTNASLTSAATIIKNGTSTCSFATAGRMTCTSGTLWDFTITYADAYVGEYKFCSQTGATAGTIFDCGTGGRHLVATGFATIANVFGSGYTSGSDWLNLYGYTSTAFSPVPASSSDPTKDALGNTLQYPGRAKYSITPVDAVCGTMASGTSGAVTNTGGVAIASGSTYVNAGTATVTIGTNSITYLAAGTIYNLRITSNGRTITFPFIEGSGATVYGYDDQGATYQIDITSSDINAFWAGRQSSYFYGLIANNNKMNNSCLYQFPAAQEVMAAYPSAFTGSVPNKYTYSQLLTFFGNQIFFDADGGLILYNQQQSFSTAVKVQKVNKMNKPTSAVFEVSGESVTVDGEAVTIPYLYQ